ncbi:MAG: flagellin [Deltaproteobacteria bacterium]|nr:flagellin [Deltaproteobacteria bacterium]
MAMRIQNNIAAMQANKYLGISSAGFEKSLERLSSGYRINRAADDAAGLGISQLFRAEIASLKVASRNTTEANSLVQVAEGGMDQIGNILTRLKELATQAASSNVGDASRAKINDEANFLIQEVDRIANSTAYSGTKLLDGSFGVGVSAGGSDIDSVTGFVTAKGMGKAEAFTVTATAAAGVHDITITDASGNSQTLNDVAVAGAGVQKDVYFSAFGVTLTLNSDFTDATTMTGRTLVGTNDSNAVFQIGSSDSSDDQISFSIDSTLAAELDSNLVSDLLSTQEKAQSALGYIDDAINSLNSARGGLGGIQNRLGYAAANLQTNMENITAAESAIRDVDMAAEMSVFTKNQILMQAGTAMLAQANMSPQMVLSLFG